MCCASVGSHHGHRVHVLSRIGHGTSDINQLSPSDEGMCDESEPGEQAKALAEDGIVDDADEGMRDVLDESELGEQAKALAEDGIVDDAGDCEIPEPDVEDAAGEPTADDGGGLPEGYDHSKIFTMLGHVTTAEHLARLLDVEVDWRWIVTQRSSGRKLGRIYNVGARMVYGACAKHDRGGCAKSSERCRIALPWSGGTDLRQLECTIVKWFLYGECADLDTHAKMAKELQDLR